MKYRSIGVLLLTILPIISSCNSDKPEPAKQPDQAAPVLPVEIIVAQKEKIPIWIEYTGKTEASQRVEVRARVSGRLEEVLFQEGDLVEKDQTLFVIEKNSYEATVAQAKAKLESDQASLKLAIADVDRYKPLVAEGLAPRVTLEQNEARVAELNAAIKADEATLADAQLQLSYTDVTAPISGRVSRKNVDVGNIVGYSDKTLLTTIVSDDPMHAYFNPNEEQYQIIQQYKSKDVLEARVTVPDNNQKLIQRKPFRGQVDFNDNRVDPMTGTITMRATVPNPDRMLLEGTFVYVDLFVTDKPEFIMLPPSVIQEDQRGSFVYAVDENSSAKRIDVGRGFESRYYALITKGLSGGEQIIANGLAKIRPGVKIKATDVSETKGVMAIMKDSDLLPSQE